jgi:hypothetical protein
MVQKVGRTDSGSEAEDLNRRGIHTGMGRGFKVSIVRKICQAYGLKNRYQRLREQGLLTQEELAAELGVSVPTTRKLVTPQEFEPRHTDPESGN